jgi:hypothetical protein
MQVITHITEPKQYIQDGSRPQKTGLVPKQQTNGIASPSPSRYAKPIRGSRGIDGMCKTVASW